MTLNQNSTPINPDNANSLTLVDIYREHLNETRMLYNATCDEQFRKDLRAEIEEYERKLTRAEAREAEQGGNGR